MHIFECMPWAVSVLLALGWWAERRALSEHEQ